MNTSSTKPRDRALPRGQQLLAMPQYNKGTAFNAEERQRHGLLGLLPYAIETLDQQVARTYRAYQAKPNDLERHIYLRQLQDSNETLFYRLVMDHAAEMIPIIYTPTVGEACKRYSEIYRRPRGLFISYPHAAHIDTMLENAPPERVEVIVMTDSEAILGIGDQGAGGMGIPIGKLALYTALGGIDPNVCLPVLLDVGTNNRALLDDPLYIGWHHERITGDDYDAFVDKVMQAIIRHFPDAMVQFEDFGARNAHRLLARYRDQLCCFNDDVQGTAAVTLGTVLAACRASGVAFEDSVIVIAGAGSAGCGIAEQFTKALTLRGLSEAEARGRLFLVDRDGLVREGLLMMSPLQERFAHSRESLAGWVGGYGLAEVIRNRRPGVLIGVSGQPGLFTEEVVRLMAEVNDRPIIMPLSNPPERCEATPEDVINWTGGRALVATGSPFPPVSHGGVLRPIDQCNNAYAFPGIGLGILAVKARRVSDEMLMAAADVIGNARAKPGDDGQTLLPSLADVRPLSREIAVAVGRQAMEQGLASVDPGSDVGALVDARIWNPTYRSF